VNKKSKEIILKYPNIFGEPPFNMMDTLIGFGFEVGDGWFPYLIELFEDINNIVINNNLSDFRIVQVKEKMGYLDIYTRNSIQEIDDLIFNLTKKLSTICEDCGSENSVMRELPYFQVLCDNCYQLKK
jgi:hypothetical protein